VSYRSSRAQSRAGLPVDRHLGDPEERCLDALQLGPKERDVATDAACSWYSAASRSPSLARSVVIAPVTTSMAGHPNLRIPAMEARTEAEIKATASRDRNLEHHVLGARRDLMVRPPRPARESGM